MYRFQSEAQIPANKPTGRVIGISLFARIGHAETWEHLTTLVCISTLNADKSKNVFRVISKLNLWTKDFFDIDKVKPKSD